MTGSSELLIVGAGPAGVSAALWARTLGLDTRLIERSGSAGGQLHLVRFHPTEIAGIATGDGPAIAATYRRQLVDARVTVEIDVAAVSLETRAEAAVVRTDDDRVYEARAVLVASGLRRRHLEVPGERELAGRGVSYSGRTDRDRFAGQDVLVVGGGDGAFENALLLAEAGCRVTLAARGPIRARTEFRSRVLAEPRIRLLEGARVTGFVGDARLVAVRLERLGGTEELEVTGAVIKIGMVPNAEWCGPLDRDAEGYLRVDPRQRTSSPGVWAAGDVARPLLPSVATAIGAAATAVADIRQRLRGG